MVMPAGRRPGSGRGGAFHCAAAAFVSTKCATAGTRFGLSHARPHKHLGAAGRQGFRNAPGMTMEPPPSQQSLPIVMGLACCNGGGLASQHALRLWAYAAPYNALASQTDAIRYGLRRRMSQCSMPAPRHATPTPRMACQQQNCTPGFAPQGPTHPLAPLGRHGGPLHRSGVRVLSAVANSGCSEQPTAAGLPLPPASKQLAASTSTRVTGVRVPCTSANGGNHPPTRSPGMILVHQTPTWVELHIRPQQHSIADAHRPTVQHDAIEVAAAQGGSRSGPT